MLRIWVLGPGGQRRQGLNVLFRAVLVIMSFVRQQNFPKSSRCNCSALGAFLSEISLITYTYVLVRTNHRYWPSLCLSQYARGSKNPNVDIFGLKYYICNGFGTSYPHVWYLDVDALGSGSRFAKWGGSVTLQQSRGSATLSQRVQVPQGIRA